jgi:peptide-methionine (S)-S-oxide reductase
LHPSHWQFFIKDFNARGEGTVTSGKVGFMGPPTAKPNPTYREVCSGTTQHVEVYDLQYTGGEQSYENLVKFFFMFHDPSTKDRQGNDRGTQYASAIFCYDPVQEEIARRVKAELSLLVKQGKVTGYQNKEITTDIIAATKFYPAQDDHQQYLEKNPWGYCNHGYRFKRWPADKI